MISENEKGKPHLLTIPYQGKKKDCLIKSIEKKLEKILPNNMKPQMTHTGRKLGSSFQIKNQTMFEHKHDTTYYKKCPVKNCADDYIGETNRKINEIMLDHTG